MVNALVSYPPVMSLIPSESYSFPDDFMATVVPVRRSTKQEPEPATVEQRQKKPAIVPLPDPKPETPPIISPQKIEPNRNRPVAPTAFPNPPLRRASAPPPRIPNAPVSKIPLATTLKPRIRWNARGPVLDSAVKTESRPTQSVPGAGPAQNVIQMQAAQAMRPSLRAVPPAQSGVPHNRAPTSPSKPVSSPRATQIPSANAARHAVRAFNPQAEFFELLAQSDQISLAKRRHKIRMRRFFVCEGAALFVFLPLVTFGLSRPPDNDALVWIMNMLTIASAVASGLIPILFFAFTPTSPQTER